LLSLPLLSFLIEDQHGSKLIGGDVIDADLNAHLRGGAQVKRTS
jgi:hypothetical protein